MSGKYSSARGWIWQPNGIAANGGKPSPATETGDSSGLENAAARRQGAEAKVNSR
jgi:hypothetical protein